MPSEIKDREPKFTSWSGKTQCSRRIDRTCKPRLVIFLTWDRRHAVWIFPALWISFISGFAKSLALAPGKRRSE
jgi:hypothetical protein